MGVVKALWKKIETKWKWIKNNLKKNSQDSPMIHWVYYNNWKLHLMRLEKEKLEILKTHQWHNWIYCNNFEVTLKKNGQNKIWKKKPQDSLMEWLELLQQP